jgi:nicotinamidase-related amidase
MPGGARAMPETPATDTGAMTILPNSEVGLGERPALLVIDATLGFTDPASPLGMDGSAALRNIASLLRICRAAGVPVFYTVNAYATPDEARVFRLKLPALNELGATSRWATVDPRVAPRTGETILRKTVPSAFFDSPLRELLRDRSADSVVVCGFSTSGCIRATAVDALQCDLRVVVVTDACDDRDRLAHDYNLRDIALKVGDVMTTDAVVAILSERAGVAKTNLRGEGE